MNPLANPDNWELEYIESCDEHRWAYIGPEASPWALFEEKEREEKMTITERKIGHSMQKISTVNLKAICPIACTAPFSELEYRATDELNGGNSSVTWWTGESYDNCEARWEIIFLQSRQKRFEIPGIPFKFMLVNGEIYYRRNVE